MGLGYSPWLCALGSPNSSALRVGKGKGTGLKAVERETRGLILRMCRFWELAAFSSSFLLVFPPCRPRGVFLPLPKQLSVPPQSRAWVVLEVLGGGTSLGPAFVSAGAAWQWLGCARGWGRGEEPWNAILASERKITFIRYCFCVYRVSREELGKKNLDDFRAYGRK